MKRITLLIGERASGKTTQLLKEYNRFYKKSKIAFVVAKEFCKSDLYKLSDNMPTPVPIDTADIFSFKEELFRGRLFERVIIDDIDFVSGTSNKSIEYILERLLHHTTSILATYNNHDAIANVIFALNRFCNNNGVEFSIYSINGGVLKIQKKQ
jgi:thymidine kinase